MARIVKALIRCRQSILYTIHTHLISLGDKKKWKPTQVAPNLKCKSPNWWWSVLQFLLSFLLVYRFGASATCFWHSLLLYNYPEWSWAMKCQNGWCTQCYDAQQIIMYETRRSTWTIWYFVAYSIILYSFSEHKRVTALLLTSARIFVSSQFSTQHIILYVPHVSVSFRVFRQFFGYYTHTHTESSRH